MNDNLTITVAIVTARKNEHTHYEKWRKVRDEFLNRQFQHALLNGELGALLALIFQRPYNDVLEQTFSHVEYQMKALLAGTDLPERVLIVDRHASMATRYHCGDKVKSCSVRRVPPMISARELALVPDAALASIGATRATLYSFGCADKNTAIVLCDTDILVMLDDCCLPSFGLVAAVREHYTRVEHKKQFEPEAYVPTVMPLSHRQLYLQPGLPAGFSRDGTPPSLEHSDANWTDTNGPVWLTPKEAQTKRRVFGVWAMPTALIRDELNGFNTLLDGVRGGDDEELLERCDRYLTAKRGEYVFDSRMRLYEIGHDMPWKSDPAPVGDWKQYCPEGWVTPGVSLSELRLG